MKISKPIGRFGTFHIVALTLGFALLVAGQFWGRIPSSDNETPILYWLVASYVVYLISSVVASLDDVQSIASYSVAVLPATLCISYPTITIALPSLLLLHFGRPEHGFGLSFWLGWVWNILFVIGTGWLVTKAKTRASRVAIAFACPAILWSLEMLPVLYPPKGF
jgi:hypothetical protein